jgi:hypothetical protein
MKETDEKGTRPLRFWIAGREIDFHGSLPFVEVLLA